MIVGGRGPLLALATLAGDDQHHAIALRDGGEQEALQTVMGLALPRSVEIEPCVDLDAAGRDAPGLTPLEIGERRGATVHGRSRNSLARFGRDCDAAGLRRRRHRPAGLLAS